MNVLQQVEADALNFAATTIEAHAQDIEAALGQVNVTISSDAVALADDVAAKLPPVIRGIVEGAIAAYGAKLAPELATIEGEGLVKLVAFLKAAAAGL